MDGDVGQGALVGLFPPVCRLRLFISRDVLVLVFWWGRSQGEGLYSMEGLACSLDLLGRMYMLGFPGTVPRYMLPVMMGAGSGWRRGEVHGVEQGG